MVPAAAHAERAFTLRGESSNTQGDITIAANSLESCLDALAVARTSVTALARGSTTTIGR
jgi:hypothetical protein